MCLPVMDISSICNVSQVLRRCSALLALTNQGFFAVPDPANVGSASLSPGAEAGQAMSPSGSGSLPGQRLSRRHSYRGDETAAKELQVIPLLLFRVGIALQLSVLSVELSCGREHAVGGK